MASSDKTTNMKLSQLKSIMKSRQLKTLDYFRPIFQTGFEINCTIKSTQYLEIIRPNLIGGTVLHLAFEETNSRAYQTLIESGADYTIKNRNGLTVLHQALEKFYTNESTLSIDNEFVDITLLAHRDFENFTNPCTNYGLSHFHAACFCNNAELVKSYSEHRISVNDSVAMNSPAFPGYSPLHFAVRSYGFQTVQILIAAGANLNAKNTEGKTALHMLVEQKIELSKHHDLDSIVLSNQKDVLEQHDLILHLLCQYNNHDCENVSHFHAACTIKDSLILESILKNNLDINIQTDKNSSFWPGYTGLHFAALCSLDNLILLLEKGAGIEIKNTTGETAFDICLKIYKPKEIHRILSSKKIWKDIVLSDNKTILLDLVNAMQHQQQLKVFFEHSTKRISAVIPTNSPLWPGYTALHLAIQLNTDLEVIYTCLEVGVDITNRALVKNCTALHLAFRLEKKVVVEILWQYYRGIPNLKDNDDLSHLHIACATGGEYDFVNKLTETAADVNLTYKGEPIGTILRKEFTPLHVAAASGEFYSIKIIKELLKRGADRYAIDCDGFTPIHWILASPYRELVADYLLTLDDIQDSVVSGLSYLHVASYIRESHYSGDEYVKNLEFVKKLLEKPKTSVNVIVNYDENKSFSFLEKLAGFTPLCLAVEKQNWKIAELLVKAGDDILVKKPRGLTPLYDALILAQDSEEVRFFISYLKDNEVAKLRVEEDTGMKMLHLACYMNNIEDIEQELKNGEKLNAQIHANSLIWPGWTPLHVLVGYHRACDRTIELFKKLEIEPDLGLKNAEGDTVIHLAYQNNYKDWLNYLLLQQNFNENPINNESFSHFHIACAAMNFQAVDKFLQSGIVEVNDCIDPFLVGDEAGKSPLHLALSSNCTFNDEGPSIGIVDLLIKNGAHVNAKNSLGQTLLHKSVELGKEKLNIFKEIVKAGADVHAIDINGMTPLDLLLFEGKFSAEHLELFIDQGCHFNMYNLINEVGCMSRVFIHHGNRSDEKRILFNMMLEHPNTIDTDEKGRTIIHNLVASFSTKLSPDNYADIISQLVTISRCNVDDQDKFGRAAIHMAVRCENDNAIMGLFIAGADVNIIDDNGNSACDHIEKMSSYRESIAIANHVRRLELLGLDVTKKNKVFAVDIFGQNNLDEKEMKETIETELELAKNIKVVSPSLSLYDFLSETSTLASYAMKENKNVIERFFRDFRDVRFEQLKYVFKLQYRTVMMRPLLIEQASVVLHDISGCPMECVEFIVKLLTNYELRSLIRAGQINEGVND